jgi:hypothetical protein
MHELDSRQIINSIQDILLSTEVGNLYHTILELNKLIHSVHFVVLVCTAHFNIWTIIY